MDPEFFIQISLLEFRAKNEPLSIDYPGWFYPSSDLEEVFDFLKKKEWSTVEFKSNLNQYKYNISDLESELYRLNSIAKIPADA